MGRRNAIWKDLKSAEAIIDGSNCFPGGFGIVLLDAVADPFEIGSRGTGPAELPQILEHPRNAGVHLFFLDEITAINGGESFPDGGEELSVILQQSINGFLNQLRRVLAGSRGELVKLRFLLRRQMNFHDRQFKAGPGRCQTFAKRFAHCSDRLRA